MTVFSPVTLNYVVFVSVLLGRLDVHAEDYFVILTTSALHGNAGTLDNVIIQLEGSLSITSQALLQGPFLTGSTEHRRFSDVNVGFICGVTISLDGKDGLIRRNLFVSYVNNGYGRFFDFDPEIREPVTKIREAVNALYGEYGPWSPCKGECGNNGSRIRRRVCDESRMGCGGVTCQRPNVEIDSCVAPLCIETTPTVNKSPVVDYFVAITTSEVQADTGTIDPVAIMIEGSLASTSQTSLGGTFVTGSTEYRKFRDVDVGYICGVTLTLNGTDGWIARNVFVSNVNRVYGRLFVLPRILSGNVNNPIDSLTIREPINASYGEYGPWGACEGACGTNGTRLRRLVCDESRMGCGGITCQGPNSELETCVTSPCIKSTPVVGLTTATTSANEEPLSVYAIALIVVSIVGVALAVAIIIILVREKLKSKSENVQHGENANDQKGVTSTSVKNYDHNYENKGEAEYLELAHNNGANNEDSYYSEQAPKSVLLKGSSQHPNNMNPAQAYENVNSSTPTTTEKTIPEYVIPI